MNERKSFDEMSNEEKRNAMRNIPGVKGIGPSDGFGSVGDFEWVLTAFPIPVPFVGLIEMYAGESGIDPGPMATVLIMAGIQARKVGCKPIEVEEMIGRNKSVFEGWKMKNGF